MTGEQANPIPLVPNVPEPRYGDDHQQADELDDRWRAALHSGDRRGMAELALEKAHRLMVKRDACLTQLVRSVQAHDGSDIALYAQLHGAYSHLMQAEIDDAKSDLARASWEERQQEAER